MSSPICVKISMYSKKFPFASQITFSVHNLEADNVFQATTACEQFFYEKGTPPPPPLPPIKNNGLSLTIMKIAVWSKLMNYGVPAYIMNSLPINEDRYLFRLLPKGGQVTQEDIMIMIIIMQTSFIHFSPKNTSCKS